MIDLKEAKLQRKEKEAVYMLPSLYWLDIPFCEAIGLKGVNGTKHIFFIPESEWNKSHIERCTIMHIFSI
ncbi:hypothetical protein GQ457_06G004220 [Hibiscus cannabinus]